MKKQITMLLAVGMVVALGIASADAQVSFVDNSNAGFTATPKGSSGSANDGGAIDAAKLYDGGAGDVGVYTATVGDSGLYNVWATWVATGNRSTSVTYSITGGASAAFNQQVEPSSDLLILSGDYGARIAGLGGAVAEDTPYELIGQVTLGAGDTLTVTVNNDGSGFAIMDAIAYEFFVPGTLIYGK